MAYAESPPKATETTLIMIKDQRGNIKNCRAKYPVQPFFLLSVHKIPALPLQFSDLDIRFLYGNHLFCL